MKTDRKYTVVAVAVETDGYGEAEKKSLKVTLEGNSRVLNYSKDTLWVFLPFNIENQPRIGDIWTGSFSY